MLDRPAAGILPAPTIRAIALPAALVLALAALSAALIGWRLAGPSGGAVAFAATLAGLFTATRLSAWPGARVLGGRRKASPFGVALAEMTDEVGIGFGIVDPDGRIIFANAALAELFGVEDTVGATIAELVSPGDHAAVGHAIERLLAREVTLREVRVEPVARPDDGLLLTIGYTRRYDRLFVNCKDDSYQLRLEAQVRQATKMQAVGQLAGGIAHDFNNILTAIIGITDLMLLRHGPGSQDHQDASQIAQNANRAANLVRQLLAFSRQQTLRPRVVQLADVIGEVGHLLNRLLGENIRLRIAHGRDLSPVRADPGQLEQVIINLAVNARDAMPGGGDLTIATYAVSAFEVPALGHKVMPPADYVALAVRDTGQGIPREIIGQVFDPFFTTKEVGKGTGLGLSMAYGIVKQTGGYIFVESASGLGTTFNIYFPAATAQPEDAVTAPVAPARADNWGQGTILVVEDEAMVRAVASRALTRSGYEVLTASSGEEALTTLAERGAIDLLISDVMMPGMDGPALVARAREAWPDLKVLFMSGYAEEQLRGRVDPNATFLRKPFSVLELSEAVRARLAA